MGWRWRILSWRREVIDEVILEEGGEFLFCFVSASV